MYIYVLVSVCLRVCARRGACVCVCVCVCILTVYVELYGLCGVAARVARHARVLAVVGHAHIAQLQVRAALIGRQRLAHLVPRDRRRRVAKQHDAAERDVTAGESLQARTGIGYQRTDCMQARNNYYYKLISIAPIYSTESQSTSVAKEMSFHFSQLV